MDVCGDGMVVGSRVFREGKGLRERWKGGLELRLVRDTRMRVKGKIIG